MDEFFCFGEGRRRDFGADGGAGAECRRGAWRRLCRLLGEFVCVGLRAVA